MQKILKQLSWKLGDNTKKRPHKFLTYKALYFVNVPTKGIEPSHPCEWQILSLLRLPIPPHGHYASKLDGKYNGINSKLTKYD